ncbi:SH2 domain-containing protein 7 [Sceloporus undulatus]|uniref:SH2 domain-containing protein 7 n=1 Tax=Sceloporus undulatus TaxID=8520 RepID=UPI001C4BE37E|nr:SH2 domain-containing protein 7 [Sceloporus undulatus]
MISGCFSPKRGKDRCRHFVISHQRNGYYAISGDTQTHPSLAELISYYQRTEIEPFSEKLTVACSKQEETSVYDKISLEQQTSSKQSSTGAPMLTRQVSGSSPIPAKANTSNQPKKQGKKLQEQKKSLSKEKPDLSPEDPDDAPPVPARSNLLLSESFEDDFKENNHPVYNG